jgi:hypothetical protein
MNRGDDLIFDIAVHEARNSLAGDDETGTSTERQHAEVELTGCLQPLRVDLLASLEPL